MNLTEDYTFKKIQKERPLKSLNVSYDQLHKQHAKLDKKYQDLFKECKDFKAKSDLQERELSRRQRTVENLVEEKCELNQIINDQKSHIRKLESKIAIGIKGGSEINTSKHCQVLKADKEALEDELNGAYEKIQELEDHISVISQALEVKATEIGNVNPLTLLTLGENKELMNKIKDKERISQVQMEELRTRSMN